MAKIRSEIQYLLRKIRLLGLVDRVRYVVYLLLYWRRNSRFIAQNPGFALPPKELAYDAYSAPDWHFYKESGENTAKFLAGVIREYFGKVGDIVICEWGCGPGRVIRHLPKELGQSARIYGSDYNPDTIAWCTGHIKGIQFLINALEPPLPFASHFFDCIYAISVFTHLSEEIGSAWIEELQRVLRPGGLLVISTHGDSSVDEFLPEENKRYETTGIVTRGKIQRGKKMFGTYHSPSYVRTKLLKDFKVVRHVPNGFPYVSQDLWISKKPDRSIGMTGQW